MSKIIGIDLGTTNSVVAVMEGGEPVVITNPEGGRLTPSVVAFTKSGERLVGQVAKRQAVTNPENTVFSIKRFMGRRFDEVGEEMKMVPYHVVPDAQRVTVKVDGQNKPLTPPEISAMILQKLKQAAEEYLGQPVSKAVITVPAYFNDAQRQATKDAGQIAGLEVMRIVNEPTAAALAYGLDKKKDETIAVYDFGGGTFDISILEVGEGVVEVKATNGDTHLGGDNLDQRVIEWINAEFKKAEGIDLGKDRMALQRLREAAEKAKMELSTVMETDINLPFITADQTGPKHLQMKLTRAKFEQLVDDLLQKTVGPTKQALADAGIDPSKIDEVVLVGGSTRIPLVRRLVGELFGKAPHSELTPDAVVALGAAVQADILITGNRDMLLLDVTPLSLGIETMGGVMSKIILRNSTIPATGQEMFTTFADNQTAVDIHVLQGERELVADNRSLDRFKIRGIPPMPAGMPRVQVQFQIDANGILSVTARELRTNVEQTIEVKPSYGLTDEDVERMLLDSFEHAEADFEARLLIDARNEAETVVLATEKSLRSPDYPAIAKGELAPGERERIDAAVADVKAALVGTDREAIQLKMKALNEATQHLAEVMMNRSVHAALSGRNVDEM